MRKPKAIVGSGLAGLSAVLELTGKGFEVLVLEASSYTGGRTASWIKEGMEVESGLHRAVIHHIDASGSNNWNEGRGNFRNLQKGRPSLGIDATRITAYRVVRHPDDFYLLSPQTNKLRPPTRTAVEGLFLAGDFVRPSFMATMEGAILIGNNAAREVKAAERRV